MENTYDLYQPMEIAAQQWIGRGLCTMGFPGGYVQIVGVFCWGDGNPHPPEIKIIILPASPLHISPHSI